MLVDTSPGEDTPGNGGVERGKGGRRGREGKVKEEPLLKCRRGPGRRRYMSVLAAIMSTLRTGDYKY